MYMLPIQLSSASPARILDVGAHLGEGFVEGVHGTADVICEQHSPSSQFLHLPDDGRLRLTTHVQAVAGVLQVEVRGHQKLAVLPDLWQSM
jgi:hypothetical protein